MYSVWNKSDYEMLSRWSLQFSVEFPNFIEFARTFDEFLKNLFSEIRILLYLPFQTANDGKVDTLLISYHILHVESGILME